MTDEGFLARLNGLDQKGSVEEILEKQRERNALAGKLEDLEEGHRGLSHDDLRERIDHDHELAEQFELERKEIQHARYSINDPEEAEEARQADFREAEDRHEELILSSEGPAAAESLRLQIERLDDEIRELLSAG